MGKSKAPVLRASTLQTERTLAHVRSEGLYEDACRRAFCKKVHRMGQEPLLAEVVAAELRRPTQTQYSKMCLESGLGKIYKPPNGSSRRLQTGCRKGPSTALAQEAFYQFSPTGQQFLE